MSFCRNHENEPFFGNLEWEAASGLGAVFAFNISYKAFHPGFEKDIPLVFALIELDEGPMFGSTVIGCAPAEVKIGQRVGVVYKDVETADGLRFTLPLFKPINK